MQSGSEVWSEVDAGTHPPPAHAQHLPRVDKERALPSSGPEGGDGVAATQCGHTGPPRSRMQSALNAFPQALLCAHLPWLTLHVGGLSHGLSAHAGPQQLRYDTPELQRPPA